MRPHIRFKPIIIGFVTGCLFVSIAFGEIRVIGATGNVSSTLNEMRENIPVPPQISIYYVGTLERGIKLRSEPSTGKFIPDVSSHELPQPISITVCITDFAQSDVTCNVRKYIIEGTVNCIGGVLTVSAKEIIHPGSANKTPLAAWKTNSVVDGVYHSVSVSGKEKVVAFWKDDTFDFSPLFDMPAQRSIKPKAAK